MRVRLSKIEHLVSASGWWCYHAVPVFGLNSRFEPLAAFAVIRWEPVTLEPGTSYSELMTVGLTLSDLHRVASEIIPDQREIDSEALCPDVYHESDFEEIGNKLKPGAKKRES
jgi:hypothetical protein